MSTITADVRMIFCLDSEFTTNVQKAQVKAYCTDSGKLKIKNSANTGVEAEFSNDTLQCLLAGSQTLTGQKISSSGGIKHLDDIQAIFGTGDESTIEYDGTNERLKVYCSGVGGIRFESSCSEHLFTDDTNGSYMKLADRAVMVPNIASLPSSQVGWTGIYANTANGLTSLDQSNDRKYIIQSDGTTSAGSTTSEYVQMRIGPNTYNVCTNGVVT